MFQDPEIMFASTMLLIAAVLLCQVEGPPTTAREPESEEAVEQAIERAVQRLGDRRFAERAAASDFLWRQGLRAEAALRRAARSDDFEVRVRAEAVLRDFDFGILPGVPEEVVELIRRFRDGDSGARKQVLLALFDGEHWDTATVLFGRVADADARRTLLVECLQNPAALDRYGSQEGIESLVESVGADQEPLWRRGTVGMLMFSPAMVERLAEQGKLSVLTAFLESEEDPQVRTLALTSAFSNPASVNRLMAEGQWVMIHSLVEAAPPQMRPHLLAQILSNNSLIAAMIRDDQLDQLFELLDDSLDDPNAVVVSRLFNSPTTRLILDTRGIDGVLEWLRQEKNPDLLLPRLVAFVSSRFVQDRLVQEGRPELVAEIAEEYLPREARREYLLAIPGLFAGGNSRALQDVELQQRLWELVKRDEEQRWVLSSVAKLVRGGRFNTVAAKESEVRWIVDAAGAADERAAAELLQAVTSQEMWLSAAVTHGHLPRLFHIVERLEPEARATTLAQIVQNPSAIDHLRSENQLERLISVAIEELPPPSRMAYLQRLLASQPAVSALVNDGQYAQLVELVEATEDGNVRASLFGQLTRHAEVIDYLVDRDELETLVEFAEEQSPEHRHTYLLSLVRSRAMESLLTRGLYDRLRLLVEEESPARDSLVAAFYSSSGVLAHFLRGNQIVSLLDVAESLQPPARFSLLQRLVQDRAVFQSLLEKDQLDRVIALAEEEPNANQRGHLLESLMASQELVAHLVSEDRLHFVPQLVRGERDANIRQLLLRGLFRNGAAIAAWVGEGELDQLVDLADAAENPVARASLLATLASNEAVLEYWVRESRLTRVWELAESLGNLDARRHYLAQAYGDFGTLEVLLEGGQFETLVDHTVGQPPQVRAQWLRLVARHPATTKALSTEGQILRLLSIPEEEQDGMVRQAFLGAVVSNTSAVTALLDEGHYSRLRDVVLSVDHPVQRATLFGSLARHGSVVPFLEQRHLLSSLLDFAEAEENEEARAAYLRLLVSSSAISSLIELGEYQRIHSLVDQASVGRDALIADFYSNPTVLTRAVEAGRVGEVLKRVEELEQEARTSFLNRLTSNSQLTARMIGEGHVDTLLSLIQADPDAGRRAALLGKLIASPEVLAMLASHDHLQRVVRLVRNAAAAGGQTRGTFTRHSLARGDAVQIWVREGLLDDLLQVVLDLSHPREMSVALAQVVASPAVLRHWADSEQLNRVFSPVEKLDRAPHQEYLRHVLTNSEVLRTLVGAGMIEDVLATIHQDSEARTRAAVLATIAGDATVSHHLQSAGNTARLISIGRDEPSVEGRQAYLGSLVRNSHAVTSLVAEGHYAALMELIESSGNEVAQANLRGGLLRHPAVIEHMVDQEQLETLLGEAEHLEPVQVREALLQSMFASRAIPRLIEAGHYDRLRALFDASARGAEISADVREMLAATFYSYPEVLDHWERTSRLAEIMEQVGAMESAAARQRFLSRVLTRRDMLDRWINSGQAEALFELVAREPEPFQRHHLLRRLVTPPTALRWLAERNRLGKVVDWVRAEPADQVQAEVLMAIVSDEEALNAFLNSDAFAGLLALVQEHREGVRGGDLVGRMLGSAQVVDHLVSAGDADAVLSLLDSERQASSREAVRATADALLRSPPALERWIEHGLLEPLIGGIAADLDLPRQASLLGRLATSPPVLDYWRRTERLDLVLDLADRWTLAGPQSPRLSYLARVVASPEAVRSIAAAGLFDRLLEIVGADGEGGVQRGVLADLLRNRAAAEHLAAEGKLELMVDLVRRENDASARAALLSGIVANDVAVQGLIDTRHFTALVDVAGQSPSPLDRKTALSKVLASKIAIDHLDNLGQLDRLIEEVFADFEEELSNEFLKDSLNQPAVLIALDRVGKFEQVVEAVERANEGIRRDQIQRMLDVDGGARLLVIHGRTSVVFEALKANANSGALQRLLGQPEFLRALADRERLGPFLDVADAIDHDARNSMGHGRSAWDSVRWSKEVIEVLAENQQIDRVLTSASGRPYPQLLHMITRHLLEAGIFDDADQPQLAMRLVALLSQPSLGWIQSGRSGVDPRTFAADMLLSDAGFRRTLIAQGQVDVLYELLSMVSAIPRRDTLRRELLYSSSGLVAHHLERGELDAAERMLDQYADDSDVGISMWAGFLLTHGRLRERIAELGSADEPAALRRLAYLHRAGGDSSAAIDAARRSGDEALVFYLTCEASDWASAAQQLAAQPLGAADFAPPVPLRRPAQEAWQSRIERLGFLAAYWRLAGNEEESSRILDEIERFIDEHPEHPGAWWHVVEALMLNGRVDTGLALLRNHDPPQALQAHHARRELATALKAADSDPGRVFDREWYLGLPTVQPAANDSAGESTDAAKARMDSAMEVREILHWLGHDRDVEQIPRTLEAYVHDQPEQTTNGQPWRRLHQQWLAGHLHRAGYHQRARRLAASAIGENGDPTSLLYDMYGARGSEADAWWTYWRMTDGEHSDRSVEETLGHIHRLLDQRLPQSSEDFQRMVEQAAAVKLLEPYRQPQYLIGLADTCIARERLDLAEWLLRQSDRRDVRTKLADVLRRRLKWIEASEVLDDLWQADRESLGTLYLSGDALVRAGEVEEGERRKRLAVALAISAQARYRLANTIADAGVIDEAVEQWTATARTAPLEHWEVHDSLRRRADHIRQSDPHSAAEGWEQYTLSMLRTNMNLRPVRYYFHMPYIIRWRRAMAAIDQRDADEALRQARLGLDSMPSGTEMALDLVRALEGIGRSDVADLLYADVRQHFSDQLRDAPDSPYLHSELAEIDAFRAQDLPASQRPHALPNSDESNSSHGD